MNKKFNVLVVGAGTMGHGIAQQAAMHGYAVTIMDQNEGMLTRAKTLVREHLENMHAKGLIPFSQIGETIARITCSTDLEQSAAHADFVFEAVFEDLQVKRALFRQLGEYTRADVVLASNTSSFDINELCAVTAVPSRVIGAHWFHPPQITPCIELITTEHTSPETLHKAQEMAASMGKMATRCTNSPGFVANRIQFAMAAEAFKIVQEGLATPEEVDSIVKSSFGFRLGAFGPFEIADQAGIDVYYSIFEYLHSHLKDAQFSPPPILRDLIDQKRLGLKTERGFYDYSGGKVQEILRERDERLFSRLSIFHKENNLE